MSYAGNTHIFIKGRLLNSNPQSNILLLESSELSQTFQAPLLTADDAFNSNPEAGFISYRVPPLNQLLGVPDDFINQYSSMTFTLSVSTFDSLLGQSTLRCGNTANCQITYKRAYTPMIYELAPPVVYHDSEVLIYFDPKSTTSLIQDLESDEKAFIFAKVGGFHIDFENSVDFDFTYSNYYRNNVKGRVGDQKPGASHDLSMLWEIGDAKINMGEALHCSYDNSTCYVAKTVPVIFGINYNAGYTSGG
jgi:hypothetical protein